MTVFAASTGFTSRRPRACASPGEVVVRVEAGALNPGALPALHGSSYTPGRDLAGDVVAVGVGVLGFTAGDAVLGRLQSWDAHAQFVAIPATQLVSKPQALSWDVADSLYTTPMAGLGAIKAVEPRPGETIVISGASGGVGFTAAQLALRAGATVIGLTSDATSTCSGTTASSLSSTAKANRNGSSPRPGTPGHAFIDAVGGGYIDLATRPRRSDTTASTPSSTTAARKTRASNRSGRPMPAAFPRCPGWLTLPLPAISTSPSPQPTHSQPYGTPIGPSPAARPTGESCCTPRSSREAQPRIDRPRHTRTLRRLPRSIPVKGLGVRASAAVRVRARRRDPYRIGRYAYWHRAAAPRASAAQSRR